MLTVLYSSSFILSSQNSYIQGVIVPAKSKTVEFRYQPSLKSLIISLLGRGTLILCIAFHALSFSGKKKTKKGSND